MNWKIFITAFVSSVLVSFPQNMIGCGPDSDPYDYHTSFFMHNLAETTSYKPFYYSSYVFLYDAEEPSTPSTDLAAEWATYCGTPVTVKDAEQFVFGASLVQCKKLYNYISGQNKSVLPDSLRQNQMAQYIIRSKDKEALGYLQYAKEVEPHVIGMADYWEPVVRDSIKMSRLIKNGLQLYKAATKDFFRLKYAYQIVRLSHYSGRYKDAVSYYDQMIANNRVKSILQPMSLSLKAGALCHLGRQNEAVYLFSKSFAASPGKRVANYISFQWNFKKETNPNAYLSFCKNDNERANLLGLMALSSVEPELPLLKEIYRLDPTSDLLEVLAVREINKTEEKYYTPYLASQPGGEVLYFNWEGSIPEDSLNARQSSIRNMGDFFHQIAIEKKAPHPALFELAASYTSLMIRDLQSAKQRLEYASGLSMTSRQKDQQALINLLILVNNTESIDRETEDRILPSLVWLRDQVLDKDQPDDQKDYQMDKRQWEKFYRSIFGEILAKRYRQQGNLVREVLAVAASEWIYTREQGNSYWGVNFMRKNLVSDKVHELYQLIDSKNHSSFEQYLLKHNTIGKRDVAEFAGTACLRDLKFAEAISWFEKIPESPSAIYKNPFTELLNDRNEILPNDVSGITKIDFARKMLQLQTNASKKDPDQSRYLYQMALALYNITYYGYSWELVEYYRSGSDGYAIPKNANSFQRNYYGCFDAHDYFKTAMDASSDPSFKARCLFMMAKCIQKQFQQPNYRDYYNQEYSVYDQDMKKYESSFMNNPYFPKLINEYSHTEFFREAYQSCSYLRDFKN